MLCCVCSACNLTGGCWLQLAPIIRHRSRVWRILWIVPAEGSGEAAIVHVSHIILYSCKNNISDHHRSAYSWCLSNILPSTHTTQYPMRCHWTRHTVFMWSNCCGCHALQLEMTYKCRHIKPIRMHCRLKSSVYIGICRFFYYYYFCSFIYTIFIYKHFFNVSHFLFLYHFNSHAMDCFDFSRDSSKTNQIPNAMCI